MAAVANTAAAHGHQPWALAAASIANRSSSRTRPTAATPTRALLVRTGFAGASNARAPPRRRAVTTVRTRAGTAGVRPSSSSPDAVTYRASISINTPLHEPPGASFDEYLQDRARVFRVMFPDQSRSERLGDMRGVADPDAAAAVPPPHRAPRRRHAAAAPRRRARPPSRA
ncbi:unnamed protein product [Urochloa humidicola]